MEDLVRTAIKVVPKWIQPSSETPNTPSIGPIYGDSVTREYVTTKVFGVFEKLVPKIQKEYVFEVRYHVEASLNPSDLESFGRYVQSVADHVVINLDQTKWAQVGIITGTYEARVHVVERKIPY